MKYAVITGASVAGLTLARLLLDRGWSVALQCRASGPRPPIVIGDSTWRLLHDVWHARSGFLRAHHLRSRIVTTDGGYQVIADEAWVPDVALRTHLLAALTKDETSAADPRHWQIDASGRGCRPRWSAGRRTVAAAYAELRPGAPRDQRWFEPVESGWLFAAPIAHGRPDAIVQLMTPAPDDGSAAELLDCALASSRLTRERVVCIRPPVSTWAGYPVIDDCWPAPRSLRIGEAAMTLDPICGDGTGYAIRGALLAAAALEAIESGDSEQLVREHVRTRLRLAFEGHLRACIETYGALTHHACWAAELHAMTEVLASLDARPASVDDLPFRLAGSQLIAARSERRGQFVHDGGHL
jgi:2-polyprenyl-6-methoxyphenol hydroxylase-like FAD-dependent oxidoreductase